MKGFAVFLGFLALVSIAYAFEQECFPDVDTLCGYNKANKNAIIGGIKGKCNAEFSGSKHALKGLQKYVLQHVSHSYKYLLLATIFGSYEKNRAGFEKLYRKLSDDSWEDAIDIIKYITKRGHAMDFNIDDNEVRNYKLDLEGDFDINELQSLSKALDLHKVLARQAHAIHGEVTKRSDSYHDPEVINFIEEEFVHKHADTIRQLSGHFNDLFDMSKINDATPKSEARLSLYLFDEYLQKTV